MKKKEVADFILGVGDFDRDEDGRMKKIDYGGARFEV